MEEEHPGNLRPALVISFTVNVILIIVLLIIGTQSYVEQRQLNQTSTAYFDQIFRLSATPDPSDLTLTPSDPDPDGDDS